MLVRFATLVAVVLAFGLAIERKPWTPPVSKINEDSKSVVVIGSGMSGLTSAAYLARAGFKVTILEQFPTIGGVTTTVRKDGFGWDIGPLIVEGWEDGEIADVVLKELGVRDKVNAERGHRVVVLPSFVNAPPETYHHNWYKDQLKQQFPAEAGNLDLFFEEVQRPVERIVYWDHVIKTTHSYMELAYAHIRRLIDMLRVRGMTTWSAKELMDHYFKDPELIMVFTGILADFSTRPSQFIGLFTPYLNPMGNYDRRAPCGMEVAVCMRFLIGGMHTLVDAVYSSLVEAGGKVETNALVNKIIVENNQAIGVSLEDGRRFKADIVVSSGNARDVFFDLVGREKLPVDFAARIQNLQVMESVFFVLLGVDFDPRPLLPSSSSPLHYFYQTTDVEKAIDDIENGEYHEGKDGFLIYVNSGPSPELAPEGHHAVTIYTVAPTRLAKGTWSEVREEMADKLVKQAEKRIPGLKEHEVTRVILTPEDFEQRTHQKRHAFGGVRPIVGQEHIGHQTPVKGLWFVGQQSERAGVTVVMDTARETVRQILSTGPFSASALSKEYYVKKWEELRAAKAECLNMLETRLLLPTAPPDVLDLASPLSAALFGNDPIPTLPSASRVLADASSLEQTTDNLLLVKGFVTVTSGSPKNFCKRNGARHLQRDCRAQLRYENVGPPKDVEVTGTRFGCVCPLFVFSRTRRKQDYCEGQLRFSCRRGNCHVFFQFQPREKYTRHDAYDGLKLRFAFSVQQM